MIANFTEEEQFWKRPDTLVFGIDEAGRGCLAGPVYASVFAWSQAGRNLVEGISDSKKLTEKKREALFEPLQKEAFCYGVGSATSIEIDRFNIFKANSLAVARALEQALRKLKAQKIYDSVQKNSRKEVNGGKDHLIDFAIDKQSKTQVSPFNDKQPDSTAFTMNDQLKTQDKKIIIKKIIYLSDGKFSLLRTAAVFFRSPKFQQEMPLVWEEFRRGFEEHCLIKGDQRSLSIASASILAKVSRDRHMLDLDTKFPEYAFKQHKGYSTKKHKALLQEFGVCEEHRRSYAPVKAVLTAMGQMD